MKSIKGFLSKYFRFLILVVLMTIFILSTPESILAQSETSFQLPENMKRDREVQAEPNCQNDLYGTYCEAFFRSEHDMKARIGKWILEDDSGESLGIPVCVVGIPSKKVGNPIISSKYCLISDSDEEEAISGEVIELPEKYGRKLAGCLEIVDNPLWCSDNLKEDYMDCIYRKRYEFTDIEENGGSSSINDGVDDLLLIDLIEE